MANDLDPKSRDLMIRTILGEAANEPPQGQAAVASVILNRATSGRYGGTTPAQVVMAPNAFEPWSRRSKELMAIKPDSAQYQNVGDIVDMVHSGDIPDQSQGATHFYSPASQAALGRQAPSWATNTITKIGGHVFYAPEGKVLPSIDPLDAINRAMAEPGASQ